MVGAFIGAIVARSGDFAGGRDDHPFREAFSRIAALAAIKLLQWHPNEVPDTVTDLVLLLHETNRYSGIDNEVRLLGKLFEASAGRRRTSFWRAIERLRTHPYVTDAESLNIWFVQHLGWPVTLTEADLGWLIDDIKHRAELCDRIAALRGAHTLWRQFGSDPDVLGQITRAAASEEALATQLTLWRNPPPDPPEHVRQMASFEEARKRNEAQAEARDKSWVELVAELRADPSVFDHLSPQTDDSVDSRLFHLWQFLSWRTHSRSRYSIDSLDMVAPIFGTDLTRRFGEALIAFAYIRLPVVLSDNAVELRHVTNFEIMALGGLSLAAATIPGWAGTLSPEQAAQASQLAIIELNGFPDYLVALAHTHPEAVRAALVRGVKAQLAAADPNAHGMLDRLEYADPPLSALIADDLAAYVADHPAISMGMLEKVVSVLIRALPTDTAALGALARERADAATDPVIAAYYLLLLFAAFGDDSVDALRAKMRQLDPPDQTILCSALLPRVVGGRFNRGAVVRQEFSVARLEEMLILAFEGIRMSDDIKHPDGEAYSIGERDEAEEARNAIFSRITATPGEATQAVLRRLIAIPNFPIEPQWLQIQAMRRAEGDAVLAPWLPEDVNVMERTRDHAPVTTADLQLLARRRFEDLAHDLVHHKFTQGDTLQAMADEDAVQRWTAAQLEERQKESYTVQRETELPEGKAPDIMLTSRHSGVDLPIEIKVVDGMTVADMDAALETQLCGQYLRHREARHGILLLVHQKPRRGWSLAAGRPLVSFAAVVAHLEAKAQTIRETSATGRGHQPPDREVQDSQGDSNVDSLGEVSHGHTSGCVHARIAIADGLRHCPWQSTPTATRPAGRCR